MPKLTTVELTPSEIQVALGLIRARLTEVERMIQGIAEGEGMDLQRHQALKTLEPQEELLRDLVMKLEGSAKEAAT